MRVVLQRVSFASVKVAEPEYYAQIDQGLLVLLGIETSDTDEDVSWIVRKIIQMRIFSDSEGKMNRSLLDVKGDTLVISQFTLHAGTKKGNRPSFIKAARPEQAIPLYEKCVNEIKDSGLSVKTGVFGADMKVELINDGPVTIILDSKMKE